MTFALLVATCVALGAYSLNLKKQLDTFQSVTIKRFDCSKPTEDHLVSLWCQLDKHYAASPLANPANLANLANKDTLISRNDYINGWVSIVQQQLLSTGNHSDILQPSAAGQAGQQQARTAFQHYLDNTITKTFITPFQQSTSTKLSLCIKEAFEKTKLDNYSPNDELQFTFGYLTGRLAAFEKPQRLDILASPATTVDTLKAMSATEAQKSQTDAMTKNFVKGLEAGIFDTMIQLQRSIKVGL